MTNTPLVPLTTTSNPHYSGEGGSPIPEAFKLKENGAHVEAVCPLFSSALSESKSKVCSREQSRN